jgi:hypothetical protein
MNLVKKIFLVCSLLIGMSSEMMAQFDKNLLCGTTSKTWNITDNFPKDSISSCNYPNNYSVDNIWTFSADHTFSFNPGSIKTSTNNQGCTDGGALSGYWDINESGELLLSLRMIDQSQVFDLMTYTVTLLTVTEFRIISTTQGNQTLVFTPLN